MTEAEMIVLFNKLGCIIVPEHFTFVYTTKEDTAMCVIISRFSMVCFYDENLPFSKVTPEIIKQKLENFKIRDKMAVIQERILKAQEDFN